MNPYLLWLIGLVLVILEFYLPGAIMGVAGGLLIFISILIFAQESASGLATFLYILGVISSIALAIRFAIWKIRHTKPDYSIYSDNDQEGYVASGYDKTAIGKTGTVLSDLKPGGYILIEGRQHQALSQSGYIVKGSQVKVIGGEGESLIVKILLTEGSRP
ncbi:MAG: serine protease [Parachlamydia sp.]|nr:serine protease [Parachlamydia sp.]